MAEITFFSGSISATPLIFSKDVMPQGKSGYKTENSKLSKLHCWVGVTSVTPFFYEKTGNFERLPA